MCAPSTSIMSVAVALATLVRAGALQRGGQNATDYPETRNDPRQPEDPCECRNWKRLFKHRGGALGSAATCGMSNELFFATGVHQPAPEHMMVTRLKWEKMCTDFFEKIADNVCVNVNIGSEYGQWCYVNKECKNLNGAFDYGTVTSNKQLKWKICESGKDKLLKDYSLTDLIKFVKVHDIPFAIADHYAWPTFYHGKYLRVREYFEPGKGNGHPISEELREELDAVTKKYNKPVTFDFMANLDPPHMIVQGQTRYYIAINRASANAMHPSTWTQIFEIVNNTKRQLL